jgi:hypothetical protein
MSCKFKDWITYGWRFIALLYVGDQSSPLPDFHVMRLRQQASFIQRVQIVCESLHRGPDHFSIEKKSKFVDTSGQWGLLLIRGRQGETQRVNEL